MVIADTGTTPVRAAHAAAPIHATRSSASADDLVSFQSMARRMTSRPESSATSPCPWPSTATASHVGQIEVPRGLSQRRPPCAGVLLAHGRFGRRVRGLGSREDWPSSASRRMMVQACVEESTPATSGI